MKKKLLIVFILPLCIGLFFVQAKQGILSSFPKSPLTQTTKKEMPSSSQEEQPKKASVEKKEIVPSLPEPPQQRTSLEKSSSEPENISQQSPQIKEPEKPTPEDSLKKQIITKAT